MQRGVEPLVEDGDHVERGGIEGGEAGVDVGGDVGRGEPTEVEQILEAVGLSGRRAGQRRHPEGQERCHCAAGSDRPAAAPRYGLNF
ncbi:hypothetical protein C5U48_23750 [Mycolicibacter virginiensis]|uniref:Uncharacterized protein n=1 Tax=Mycolicibacter virginiensis TaxID=1795032 RepID=A0A9X7IIQ9_9MYCO|nr:hypothetical protein C5U48_23750 [Mycolicibacter virginiensis]